MCRGLGERSIRPHKQNSLSTPLTLMLADDSFDRTEAHPKPVFARGGIWKLWV
jgi:hypothetical protein